MCELGLAQAGTELNATGTAVPSMCVSKEKQQRQKAYFPTQIPRVAVSPCSPDKWPQNWECLEKGFRDYFVLQLFILASFARLSRVFITGVMCTN